MIGDFFKLKLVLSADTLELDVGWVWIFAAVAAVWLCS